MGVSLRSLGLRSVVIANQKGGVGKTTTALSLATGLVRAGQRVLAVDGDPQGNLSLFFGVREGGDFGDLIAELSAGRRADLRDFVAESVRPGLDLLPALHRRLRAERSDADFRLVTPAFCALIDSARESYDWIIMDSSPSDGALERLLVSASEAVLVPLEFQLFSIAGLEAMIEDVASCALESGRTIRVHALIFTKAESKVGRVNEYRKLFASFRIPIFEICKSEYLPRSVERAKTIWEGGPSSFAARDYARVIEKAFLE